MVRDFEPISLIVTVRNGRRESHFAGEEPGGIDRLAEGQPGKAPWPRGAGGGAHVGGTYFLKNTGTASVRALSRRRAAHPGFAGGPHRPDLLGGMRAGEVRAGQIKAYVVMAKTPLGRRPKCQPWTKPACRGFTLRSGTDCGRRRERPRTSSPSSIPRSSMPWPIRGTAAVRRDRPGTWPRDQQTPEALAAQQKAEIEKWWPIIKAAGIKAE